MLRWWPTGRTTMVPSSFSLYDRLRWRLVLLTAFVPLIFLTRTMGVSTLPLTLCSEQNTGADKFIENSVFQSLGLCKGNCSAYAFAVVQSNDCFCSNFAPANTVSASECDTPCPGYPYEKCGGEGLFGYLAMDGHKPSGTATPNASPAAPTPPSPKMVTPISTPITTQLVRTIGGTIVTSTVTVMPSSASSSKDQLTAKSKMSSGSIIAIAVASVIVAVMLIVAILMGWCCWRKKHRPSYGTVDSPGAIPRRDASVMSKTGLLGPMTTVQSVHRHPERAATRGTNISRRGSRYDQRLNPSAFTMHDGESRSSFLSMQDNRDYTRTLNVRNPDPAE